MRSIWPLGATWRAIASAVAALSPVIITTSRPIAFRRAIAPADSARGVSARPIRPTATKVGAACPPKPAAASGGRRRADDHHRPRRTGEPDDLVVRPADVDAPLLHERLVPDQHPAVVHRFRRPRRLGLPAEALGRTRTAKAGRSPAGQRLELASPRRAPGSSRSPPGRWPAASGCSDARSADGRERQQFAARSGQAPAPRRSLRAAPT